MKLFGDALQVIIYLSYMFPLESATRQKDPAYDAIA
jgi:hypothetical protein